MRNVVFKSVELKNFKVHKEMSLDFSSNRLLIISGENGSGKTSIFDAIYWALYNTLINGKKGDDVVRKRSGKNTYVKLSFSVDDDEYVITHYRKHSKHGNSKHIYKNGKNVTLSSSNENNDLIRQILMPAKVFLNCLMFSQFAKNSFAKLNHSGQKEILDQILNLGIYEEYREKIKEISSEKEEEINSAIHRLESLKDQLGLITSQIKKNKESEETIRRDHNCKKEQLNEKINAIKKFLVEFEIPITQRYQEQKDKILSLQSRVTELETNLANQTKLYNSDVENEKKRLRSEEASEKAGVSRTYQTRKQDTANRIKKIENDLTAIENELRSFELEAEATCNTKKKEVNDKCKEGADKLEEVASTIRESILSLRSDYLSKKSECEILSQKVESIDSILTEDNPICPTCNQPLKTRESYEKLRDERDQHVANISLLEKDVAEIKQKGKTASTEEKEVRDKIEKGKGKASEIVRSLEKDKDDSVTENSEKSTSRIEELNSSKKEHSLELQQVNSEEESEIEDIVSKFEDNLKKSIGAIRDKHKSIGQQWKTEKDRLKSELAEAEEVMSDEVEPEKKKVDEARNGISNLQQQIKSAEESAKLSMSEFAENIKRLQDDISKNKSETKDINSSIKGDKRKIDILGFWIKAFSDTGIKSIILDESIPILNQKAKELYQLTQNIKVSFDSQTTLKSGEQRNRFAINALHTRNLSEYSEFSAGEERMVNIITLLCLRQLMEQMQGIKMNVLLFDECLDTLDPKNVGVALTMLRGLSKEYFVGLVTHTLRDSIECDESLAL